MHDFARTSITVLKRLFKDVSIQFTAAHIRIPREKQNHYPIVLNNAIVPRE